MKFKAVMNANQDSPKDMVDLFQASERGRHSACAMVHIDFFWEEKCIHDDSSVYNRLMKGETIEFEFTEAKEA